MASLLKYMFSDKLNENGLSENRFRNVFILLRWSGIPIYVPSTPRFYMSYIGLVTMCFYLTNLSMIMDFIVHLNDLKIAMKNMRILIGMQIVAWLHICFRIRKRDFDHLVTLTEQFTWEDLPSTDQETGNSTKAAYIPLIQWFSKSVAIFLVTFHIIQSMMRILLARETIFTTWYPFNVSSSPAFEFANISQGFASIPLIGVFNGFLFLYASLVCVACSQLEKLRISLMKIRQRNKIKEILSTDTYKEIEEECNMPSEESLRQMVMQLKMCIRHHQIIKDFMLTLEETFTNPMCGLFLLQLSSMCIAAFSAITSWGDHADVAQGVMMYALMTSSVCVFCWLSNELTTEAERVKDAAWNLDWVGTPGSFQTCLLFIIATTNKEFTLTAGKFIPVSNSTMMKMMNQTVSFFMFLLQMKDKNLEV